MMADAIGAELDRMSFDVTFTAATVGTLSSGSVGGTIQVEYTPRNADGSITAYGAGLTNS
jgi:hypothetical protein